MCATWAAAWNYQVKSVVTTYVCLHPLGLISIKKHLGLFIRFDLRRDIYIWVDSTRNGEDAPTTFCLHSRLPTQAAQHYLEAPLLAAHHPDPRIRQIQILEVYLRV